MYNEHIEIASGSYDSTICEKIIIQATVYNPDNKKISELVAEKLDKLYTTSLTYVFSILFQVEKFDKKCLQKIQNNYSIISYDFEDGATIEYVCDFFISVKCSFEQVSIKLHTKYDFSFSKAAATFLPEDFMNWLI